MDGIEEMTGIRLYYDKFKNWCIRNISRKLPKLVWYDDELDVLIRFSEDPLNQHDPMKGLENGGLAEIEQQLRHMGIEFDKGQGFGGRDWEWDWSLKGPISIKFRAKAKKPENRAPVKPKLTVVH